jgi:integrase
MTHESKPLADYLLRVLASDQFRDKEGRFKTRLESVAEKFSEFIGREATLDDFKERPLKAFAVWLRTNGLSVTYARRSRWYLRRLWRLAYWEGEINTFPKPDRHKNRQQAIAKLMQIAAPKPETTAAVDESSPLLLDFYQAVYVKRLQRANRHSRYQFESAVARLGCVLSRPPRVADLNEENILMVMNAISAKGRSPATANSVRKKLVALMNCAASRRLIVACDVPAFAEYKRTPTAWRLEQLDKLIKSCAGETGTIADIPARLWWECLMRLFWDTALRIGVTLRIRWEHVNLNDAVLLAVAEHQKDKEDQQFLLGSDTVEALRAIEKPMRRLILPWLKDRSMLWYDYSRILARAGLPAGRRDKFHKNRRSTASWFEHRGGNATELLGHSSRRTTKAYLDPTIVQRTHASQILPRLGGNGGAK